MLDASAKGGVLPILSLQSVWPAAAACSGLSVFSLAEFCSTSMHAGLACPRSAGASTAAKGVSNCRNPSGARVGQCWLAASSSGQASGTCAVFVRVGCTTAEAAGAGVISAEAGWATAGAVSGCVEAVEADWATAGAAGACLILALVRGEAGVREGSGGWRRQLKAQRPTTPANQGRR
ncbi:hypothetical protein V8C86DRAFT_2613732 [Haematococcus lacustris]